MKAGRTGFAPSAPAASPTFWARSRYRINQFLHGWRAEVTAADRALAAQVLSPPALALFAQMPPDAQAHSLRVLRSLLAEEGPPATTETLNPALYPALAQAALLHDVGKVAALQAGAYLGLWLRGPIVLVEALHPAWLRRLADARPGPTLGYALYVQLEHARIGAAMAHQAGCDALTCWLIAHHQDDAAPAAAAIARDFGNGAGNESLAATARRSLARLQQADGKN